MSQEILTECIYHLNRRQIPDHVIQEKFQYILKFLEIEDVDVSNDIFVSDLFPIPAEFRNDNDKEISNSIIHPPNHDTDQLEFYQLVMIGIKPSASANLQAWRATVLDTKNGIVVCSPSPTFMDAYGNKLPSFTEELVKFKVIKPFTEDVEIKRDNLIIRQDYCGFPINIFRYKGVSFFASNYRFWAGHSWLGDGDAVLENWKIWTNNQGPTMEHLFGNSYSPNITYNFELLHPNYCLASLLNFTPHAKYNGRIAHIASYKNNNRSDDETFT